jgi:hypothetical protein
MKQVRILIASLTAAIAFLCIFFAPRVSRGFDADAQQGNSEQIKKWQALSAVDEAAEETDVHKRNLRQSKNRRYNSTRSDQLLTEQPSDVVSGRIDESARPSPLPIPESDAVILGTVVGAQPYLTEDKKSIYTEFTVHIEEMFKSAVPAYMTNDNLMVMDQEGGALRLKDGHLLRYVVAGTSRLPSLKRRYVFFVSLVHDAQDLKILTGYEIRNGSVISLEDGGDKSIYANWDERRFLSALRNAATQRSVSLQNLVNRP